MVGEVVELRGVAGDLVTLWEEIILDLEENNVSKYDEYTQETDYPASEHVIRAKSTVHMEAAELLHLTAVSTRSCG